MYSIADWRGNATKNSCSTSENKRNWDKKILSNFVEIETITKYFASIGRDLKNMQKEHIIQTSIRYCYNILAFWHVP